MMRKIVIGLLIVSLLSCGSNQKDELERMVIEWEGKEVLFPAKSRFTLRGKDTVNYLDNSADFKILTYVDTIGCTSCRLDLADWMRLIQEIDSISAQSVKFYFYIFSKDTTEIHQLLQTARFDHPVCMDTNDELNRLNQFPVDERFQTFLLDRDNKVLLIGNPIHNSFLKELYLETIVNRRLRNASKKKD